MPPPPLPPSSPRSGPSASNIPTKRASTPSQNVSVPATDNDLNTDYPDAIKLRWRSSETGPYSWDQVDQMLRNRQVGYSHEVFWLGKWHRLKDVVQRIEADRRTASIRQEARAQEALQQQKALEARLQQEAQRVRELEEQRGVQHQAEQGHQFRLAELDVQKVRIKSASSSGNLSNAIAGTFVILIVVGLIGGGLYFAFDKWGKKAGGTGVSESTPDPQPDHPFREFTEDDIKSPSFGGFGSGFFITDDGYFITNHHVVVDKRKKLQNVKLVVSGSIIIEALVVRIDEKHDLALLKANGKFSGLPILASQHVRLGTSVATIGFPVPYLQGYMPKLTTGVISGLAGINDQTDQFQHSAPTQGGNSGGVLFDNYGNAVGAHAQRLGIDDPKRPPQLVGYAVKGQQILALVELLPVVKAKLRVTSTNEIKFVDLVEKVNKSVGMVLVYDK